MSGTRRGFTLTQVLIALILAVGIVYIVSYTLQMRVARSRTTICASNMRQIGVALSMYAADQDKSFPPIVSTKFTKDRAESDKTWRDLISGYISGPAFPSCPQAKAEPSQDSRVRSIDVCGYALNERLNTRLGSLQQHSYSGKTEGSFLYPALTIAVFDARVGILALRGPDVAVHENDLHGVWRTDMVKSILSQAVGAERHDGEANYDFADGHVSRLSPTQILSDTKNVANSSNTRPFF